MPLSSVKAILFHVLPIVDEMPVIDYDLQLLITVSSCVSCLFMY